MDMTVATQNDIALDTFSILSSFSLTKVPPFSGS